MVAILWFCVESYSWRDRSLEFWWMVPRGGAALLVGPVVSFLYVSRGYCSSWRSLPLAWDRASLVARARRARCPRNDTGVLGIGGTEPSRAGEPETFFSSCMPGVNLSPDSDNIFSQTKKRHITRGSNEPARVDAPGRAISKAERRRVDPASARSAVRRATLACTLVSRHSDVAPEQTQAALSKK